MKRYLLLIYTDPTATMRPMEEWMDFHGKYGPSTMLKAAERLHDVSTATTVRMADDRMSTTDGPFAETKEHLGGIYIFECNDLDEAIKIAAECPGAKEGSIEIRPVYVR